MDQGSRNLNLIINFVLFTAVVALAVGYFLMRQDVAGLREKLENTSSTTQLAETNAIVSPTPESDCGDKCKLEIDRAVSESIATISASPVVKTVSSANTTKQKRYTYLNLNGVVTTQNTDWTDVTTTDVWINAEGEYGKDAYIDWEASVKVQSSGSRVYVRLYDVTHNIAVNSSELSSNSITSARVASGRLYLWAGQNLYRVQIRSLNGLDSSFDGGRIKIVY